MAGSGESQPVEGRAKRLTRQSIQLMTLTGKLKRSSLLSPATSPAKSSMRSPLTPSLGGIVEESAAPPVKTAEEEEDERMMLEMLKDSYREVTGRMMPEGMSAEEAMAELRMLQAAAWQKLCDDDEPRPGPEDASPLDKLRRGGKKARMSLRIGGIIMKADPMHGEATATTATTAFAVHPLCLPTCSSSRLPLCMGSAWLCSALALRWLCAAFLQSVLQ